MARTAKGESTRPKIAAAVSTAVLATTARVALHITSPNTMSAGLMGVKSMAS